MKSLSPYLSVVLLIVIVGCDAAGADSDDPEFEAVWMMSFDSDAAAWIDSATGGAQGWCGTIEHVTADSGPVSPSDGSGYAVVEQGACNAYWQEQGFATSGPYGPFGPFSDSWPDGGFVGALDVYLDPAWANGGEGNVFTYATSITLLDQEFPNFRYFFVPVTRDDAGLVVSDFGVKEAGWYTFQFLFSDENGKLDLDFELVRDDRVLAMQEISSTALSEEAASTFTVSNVGTGYAWFVGITPELRLPIDEQRLMYRRR